MVNCLVCENEIVCFPSQRRKFCSRDCKSKDMSRQRGSVTPNWRGGHKRFEIVLSGCWEWRGAIGRHGYGVKSRGALAHRFMYEYFKGPIPEGLHIDHLCRNKICVNPDHLEAVTQAENNRRMAIIRRLKNGSY